MSEPTDPPRAGPLLLGRDTQVHRFRRSLAEAGRGGPALIEVVGDPGIGKTRLLREYAVLARAQGWEVLQVGATAGGAPCDIALAVLSAAGVDPAGDRPDELDRQVRQLLTARHGPGGGPVLVIDDLHHADAASLNLVGWLLRVPPDGLVMVVAYRPRQGSQAMAATLADAAVRREVVHLHGLSAGDTSRLLGVAPGLDADRVYERSRGNPLYAHAYRDASAFLAADELPEELPVVVTTALEAELAVLSPDERAVLEAAAVFSDGFDPTLAAAVAGVDERRCADLLDHLVAKDLLRAGLSDEPGLRFRHPVVRAAAYRSIRPGRRRRMHATAARLLNGLGRAPVAYAEHVARSAQPGDLDAACTLLGAAESGGAAASTAAQWLTVARRLLPGGVADELRFRVDVALADALVAAGRLLDGRDLLHELACDAAGASERSVQVALARARLERLRGRPHEALAVLRSDLDRAAGWPAPLRAILTAEAAVCAALCSSPETARHAAAARALAGTGPDDPMLAARLDTAEAFVALFLGEVDGLPASLDRAAAFVDSLPDGRLAQHLDLLNLLGWAEALYERDHDALRHFDRALDISGRPTCSPLIPYLLAGRSRSAIRLGRLDQAGRDAIRAEQHATELGMEPLAGLMRSFRANVVAWQQGPADALAIAESALTDAAAQDRDRYRQQSFRVAARIRHLCDERTDTLAALQRACGGADLSWVEACMRPFWSSVLADMARRGGDQPQAERWVVRAERYAAALGLRGQTGHAHLARARLALEAGLPSAAQPAQAAAATFADLGWLPDEGNARLVLAGALLTHRHWRAAEAQLAEVRRIADLIGSPPLRQAVVAEQRRAAGRAGRATGRAGVDGESDALLRRHPALTRREWDIVQLVASGVSNGEVAERLFVTVKTVEAHLTRIFRKLGVSSRVGLVVAITGPSAKNHLR